MTKKATFGAGCFWHVETTFRETEGVIDVTVGYMGGDTESPTYEDVCTDKTGHVEVAQVEFDPTKISYEELLEVFWKMHDPTQLNKQGPDVGTQYRTVIFYHNEEQKKAAEESLGKHQKDFDGKIVTSIEKAGKFNKAEEYHQRYDEKNR